MRRKRLDPAYRKADVAAKIKRQREHREEYNAARRAWWRRRSASARKKYNTGRRTGNPPGPVPGSGRGKPARPTAPVPARSCSACFAPATSSGLCIYCMAISKYRADEGLDFIAAGRPKPPDPERIVRYKERVRIDPEEVFA